MPLPDKVLLRPDQVATYWSVTVRTIYRWIEQDTLPVVRTPGGQIRIPRAAMQREATHPTSSPAIEPGRPPERALRRRPGLFRE